MTDPAFWAGKRVFLTGHTGFKGAWASLWLSMMGAEVTGFSRDIPTTPSLHDAFGLPAITKDLRGDVTDLAAVEAAMRAARPDIVLHLAAQSLVRLSYREPVDTYATNVMGTVHVLEAARRIGGVAAVLIVTSDKCYENREWIWGYRENDPMGGHDPYSSSKGAAEIVAMAYARSFPPGPDAPRIVSARAGNVIGGGDWALDRLVPDLMRGLAAGVPVPIRNPAATRPWQHVLEPLGGYLLLVERVVADAAFASQGWNFGPDPAGEQPVRLVADMACGLWGQPDGWQDVSSPDQPHEAHLLRLDSTKARSLLGWAPRWTLAQALGHTVDFYRAHGAGQDVSALAQAQIRAYMQVSQGSPA